MTKRDMTFTGLTLKAFIKKPKQKFDEDGYDKQRFGRDGYAKDGSKKNQSDNGKHNLSKNISKDLIENWQRKNPPDNSGSKLNLFCYMELGFNFRIYKKQKG